MSDLCILCRANELVSEIEKGARVCIACRASTGLVPLPKSRRPPLPCARCQHTELVRVVPRELTASGGDRSHERAAPMMATYAVQSQERMIFRGHEVHPPDVQVGHGILETYICRACGFVEWYCQRPEELPIGPAYNSELVAVGEPTYRG